jgi:mannose-6-phosphate isomerase-like protein (cupin superfamily)
MSISVINLKEKCLKINELHSYKVVAQMNDYYFKLVKVNREFVWHSHNNTDEVFILIDGYLRIELRDKALTLKPGEMLVIPKGVEHRTISPQVSTVLLIEPMDTVNTGDADGSLTDNSLEWI